jgi:hypothetical protein
LESSSRDSQPWLTCGRRQLVAGGSAGPPGASDDGPAAGGELADISSTP